MSPLYRKLLERILALVIKAIMSHSSTDKAGYILDAQAKFCELKKMKDD